MTATFHQIIRQHASPLQPLPTTMPSNLPEMRGLRAVIFDVYGTMFVSGSGDVGTAEVADQAGAWSAALRSVGLTSPIPDPTGVKLLYDTIRLHHQRLHADGVDDPEVNIVDIWRDVVEDLTVRESHSGSVASMGAVSRVDYHRLALEYESRVNPVWPMPGVKRCLDRLRQSGLVLGIISNAQFFTVELFPALLHQTPEALGFDPKLQYYSYRYYRAKPGLFLYQRAKEDLATRGMDADQVLYVGNDMLNDVLPASQCGFRTALFAGDARSLRRRQGDPRVQPIEPDMVLTDLSQLPPCLCHSHT